VGVLGMFALMNELIIDKLTGAGYNKVKTCLLVTGLPWLYCSRLAIMAGCYVELEQGLKPTFFINF
jgi:hypothetical protein